VGELGDVEAVLQPDEKVAARHQAAHQVEGRRAVEITTQGRERLAPVIRAEIAEPGFTAGGLDQ